ncbi:MAG TPA: prepilin-type N-terminal cleavage/methylation domain-containing protein [Burkholderiales bacterium]|nr:prepilin-type N-terminal cleavage/methylation domain-containing protein [Burkholderiales bacterium]
MRHDHQGFTLIEIAIVLVIIGLLLGGVLKGQELITGARVRNLIAQQDGIKAAFFAFQDRYRAFPGDYAAASANINCGGGCADGNGNGRIDNGSAGSSHEEILAWSHLASAGFLNGSYVATAGTASAAEGNTPKNPYGAFVELVYDGVYGTGTSGSPGAAKHNLKTGNQVPVEIMAEVDRKIDDGKPYSGAFQFSLYASGGSGGPAAANCVDSASPPNWKVSGSETNCGGVSLF